MYLDGTHDTSRQANATATRRNWKPPVRGDGRRPSVRRGTPAGGSSGAVHVRQVDGAAFLVASLTARPTYVELTLVQRNRPPSAQTINVLRALAAEPATWRYGYDLATEVHLKSGSLYPILVRLADRGLLETSWEPGVGSRPPRHLYRLTSDGRDFVAALSATRIDRSVPRPHSRWSEA